MIDKNLHLRRRKDGVEVITIEPKRRYSGSTFTAVRYVKSGRMGYLKDADLETDFVVVGKADPDQRWSAPPLAATSPESAAALEDLREQDIAKVRKRILDQIEHPEAGNYSTLRELKPSANAIARLDEAIHMILAGV